MNKEECKGKWLDKEKSLPCISLIGMPASGKSTIGAILARKMGWAYMDSDFLLEALYACRLQDIVDSISKEEFLDCEEKMILSIKSQRCVIGTGGSVIYRPRAMAHLASLGPLVYIESGLDCLRERIALNPQRGIAKDAGQSLEELFRERQELYRKYADFTCNSEQMCPDDCAAFIWEKVGKELTGKNANKAAKRKYQHD